MSQPAVSRALSRLRSIFDDPLFVKGAGGVIATPRAMSLQLPMASLLSELRTVIGGTTFDPTTCTRVFRIATTDYGALAVFAPAIDYLMDLAPNIGLEILPLADEAFAGLGTGNIDLALYSDDPIALELSSMALFEERYVTLMRAGHAAAGALQTGRLTLEQFLAYGHILVTIGGDRTGEVDTALAALGKSRWIALSLPYFATAAVMASKTDLLLTIPERVAANFAAGLALEVVKPPVQVEGFGYRLLWHKRSDSDPGNRWLRESLRYLTAGIEA